jgi:hypothetical protein
MLLNNDGLEKIKSKLKHIYNDVEFKENEIVYMISIYFNDFILIKPVKIFKKKKEDLYYINEDLIDKSIFDLVMENKIRSVHKRFLTKNLKYIETIKNLKFLSQKFDDDLNLFIVNNCDYSELDLITATYDYIKKNPEKMI